MKKLILFALFFFGITLSWCGTPTNIVVSIENPLEVNSWDIFEFSVIVKNNDTKDRELTSITLDNEIFEWIAVLKTIPETKEESSLYWEYFYDFYKNIPANSEEKIIFKAKAITSWVFWGGVDVCIDGFWSYIEKSIRTVIY